MFVNVEVNRGRVKIEEAGKTDEIQLRLPNKYSWALNSNLKIDDFIEKFLKSLDKIYSKHGIEVYMCKECRSVYLVERENDEVIFYSFAESSFWDGCFCDVLNCI